MVKQKTVTRTEQPEKVMMMQSIVNGKVMCFVSSPDEVPYSEEIVSPTAVNLVAIRNRAFAAWGYV